MKYFKDKNGKEYHIELTIGKIKKIKEKMGVDLLDVEGGETPLIQRLLTDELLLAEIVCTLIESQIADKTGDEILDTMDGTTITNATKAFFEEYKCFFMERGRTDRAEAVSKATFLMDRVIDRATQEIKAYEVDLDEITANIKKSTKSTSGN